MAFKVGVLLSGCGVFDGSEIHEAVLTMLVLDQAGAEILCTAPNCDQYHVLNHLTQQEMTEKRNVLVESARIARGDIIDLQELSASELDALILPGGFGAVKNLSTFALKGPNADVHPQVQRILEEMLAAHKPIGAICIAPATLTRALATHAPDVTIGSDPGTASAIEVMGGKHHTRDVDQIFVDEAHKIVSTPAYMLGPGIKDIFIGIEKLVLKVLAMAA
jgi:enhancing lycopene biosynthesis protein 2